MAQEGLSRAAAGSVFPLVQCSFLRQLHRKEAGPGREVGASGLWTRAWKELLTTLCICGHLLGDLGCRLPSSYELGGSGSALRSPLAVSPSPALCPVRSDVSSCVRLGVLICCAGLMIVSGHFTCHCGKSNAIMGANSICELQCTRPWAPCLAE